MFNSPAVRSHPTACPAEGLGSLMSDICMAEHCLSRVLHPHVAHAVPGELLPRVTRTRGWMAVPWLLRVGQPCPVIFKPRLEAQVLLPGCPLLPLAAAVRKRAANPSPWGAAGSRAGADGSAAPRGLWLSDGLGTKTLLEKIENCCGLSEELLAVPYVYKN